MRSEPPEHLSTVSGVETNLDQDVGLPVNKPERPDDGLSITMSKRYRPLDGLLTSSIPSIRHRAAPEGIVAGGESPADADVGRVSNVNDRDAGFRLPIILLETVNAQDVPQYAHA